MPVPKSVEEKSLPATTVCQMDREICVRAANARSYPEGDCSPVDPRYDGVMTRSALLFAILLLPACSKMCANEVVSRASSPDGQLEAVMFQRDCGATTAFSTQISVVDARETVTEGGNAFRADDNHGAAPVGDWGGPWADLKWLSSTHLLIRYASKARLFAKNAKVGGVTVSYQAAGS
jgi:hypothetical protein